MEYADFYDIAEYGNEAWKGSFTPKEVAENAYNYLCEFEFSKEEKIPTHTIKELARLLAEDGSEICKDWLCQIAEGIGLIDMDYKDFIDMDKWLKEL